jgi:hypothetical protein
MFSICNIKIYVLYIHIYWYILSFGGMDYFGVQELATQSGRPALVSFFFRTRARSGSARPRRWGSDLPHGSETRRHWWSSHLPKSAKVMESDLKTLGLWPENRELPNRMFFFLVSNPSLFDWSTCHGVLSCGRPTPARKAGFFRGFPEKMASFRGCLILGRDYPLVN